MQQGRVHNLNRKAPPAAESSRPAFWRSLEELAASDEFQEWAQAEFPQGMDCARDGVSRREALQLMAASFLLAGLGGCRKFDAEEIVPPVLARDAARASASMYFATAIVRDGYAQGVLVHSRDGRPIKIEGNPDHPASLGATDAFTQASILTLYDPDRSQAVYRGQHIDTWPAALAALRAEIEKAKKTSGRGLRFLSGTITSPTLLDQLGGWLRDMPEAGWHVHDPLDSGTSRQAAELFFGAPTECIVSLAGAMSIVSLDCDFLHGLPGSVRHARDFSAHRKVRSENLSDMSRLFVAEPCPTVTGSNADHRLPAAPKKMEPLAFEVARVLGVPGVPRNVAGSLTLDEQQWTHLAVGDLKRHRGNGLVLAGLSQSLRVQSLALAINAHLGNLGRTLILAADPIQPRPRPAEELVRDAQAGLVQTLIIVDANPVYDAPADWQFKKTLANVPFTAHLGLYRDETARQCAWHLPLAHDLESWGDARGHDGTVTILQPMIAPLYEGRTALSVLAAMADRSESDLQLVRAYWQKTQGNSSSFETWWKDVLKTGIVADTAIKPVDRTPQRDALVRVLADSGDPDPPEQDAADAGIALHFQPDPVVRDGRMANNGWLQELPKPLTKLTWDNAALLGPRTAARLGIQNEDVVELKLHGRVVKAPAWILPGHADDCVTVSLGYGRWAAGNVGNARGFNAYELRSSDGLWQATGLTLRSTGTKWPLACTQDHQTMAGRDVLRVRTAANWHEDQGHGAPGDIPLLLFPDRPQQGQQWAMVIDLSLCIGCSACTIACQAENNIPVVGKEQVRRQREMHWIRLDRYFEGSADNPRIHHQPVPCMHCENAPCELVCPVAATTHSHDGLNEMTYNRCIGTRYCSNNCPYKVRRFNFFPYVDRTTPSLALFRNPEVTVRGLGVMEKCTYCVQRIRNAQIEARKENRPLRDGEVVSACQQACPTQAIVFGDMSDRDSQVSSLRRQPHNYGLLAELNTRPRTTYLARVQNPDLEGLKKGAPR